MVSFCGRVGITHSHEVAVETSCFDNVSLQMLLLKGFFGNYYRILRLRGRIFFHHLPEQYMEFMLLYI